MLKKVRIVHLVLIYALTIIAFFFLLFLNFYPVDGLLDSALSPSTKIYDRNGVVLYETLNPKAGKTTSVSLANIPQGLIQATIATEDENFYTNSGINLSGIARALIANIKAGRIVSGGSTITQQLVRNLVGTAKKRTVAQKIKESLLALRITRVLSKDQILELYLNKIYYGNLYYGAAAASRGYFEKDLENLDLAESAFLAGLPQAPSRYNPFEHLDEAINRRDHVLSRMYQQGFVSDIEFKAAKEERLHFQRILQVSKAPHFVNYIIEELDDTFGSEFITAGFHVRTTLDYYIQERVEKIVRDNLSILQANNVTNASVLVFDAATNEILAMVGSADYFDKTIDGQVNVALRPRQPGSALKPIVYELAFENGWNGATEIRDEPVRFFTAEGNPYLPKNYDYRYHGDVTVRESLANSYNIPAVKTLDFVGVESMLDRARLLGLSTLTKAADYYGLALTLGAGEVRLLDLTNVYATFARYGIKKEPISMLEVRSAAGDVLFSHMDNPGKRVLPEAQTFMITDILSDSEARIPQFGLHNELEIDRPAAAKTGTTRNFKDNWTLGYTPDFVVGVWVGNSDNSPMIDISGIHGAGPIWHDVMTEIHRGLPKKEFAVPKSVVRKGFCVERVVDSEECLRTIGEWEPIASGAKTAVFNERPALKITNPFDLDEFEYNAKLDSTVQQIKLSAEKADDVGDITWYVDNEKIGTGDEIFWSIYPGEFEIRASAGPINSAPVKITVRER